MPKIAICYWGMTRSTRYVYQSHYDCIFDVLKENGAEYDVFLHTWKTDKNYIWHEETQIQNDYTEHEYLKPLYYQIDDQDDFLNSIDINDYYYEHETIPKWPPQMIKNYLCALESSKRCFQMCINSNIKYDYVMFLRPDVRFQIKLPYSDIFENKMLNDNTFIVVDNDWFGGYNDRFAIMKFNEANWYRNRINELADYRKNIGTILSEHYTKYIVDKYYKNLQSIYFPFEIIRPF